MAFTDKTINLELPQWVDADKPTWLGDVNLAFIRVDNGWGEHHARLATVDANYAALMARVVALETANTNLTTRVSTLEGNA